MAYSGNNAMPTEYASKLGHLPIVKDEFVSKLIKDFESFSLEDETTNILRCENFVTEKETSISSIISVDGSCSHIVNPIINKKSVSFIKVATLMISLQQLQKAQATIVDPTLISEIISKYADTISTVLPLNNVRIKELTPLETIRKVINATLKEKNAMLYDTLKFLVFRQWDPHSIPTTEFGCPVCNKTNIINGEFDEFNCNNNKCKSKVYLSDYISLHKQFDEEYTNESLAMSFMQVIEHLLFMSYLRILYQEKKNRLSQILLMKDGPLALHAQYSRLVNPIRDFIQHLKDSDIKAYIVGIEKSGPFFDHAEILSKRLKQAGAFLIPDNKYIFSHIKHGNSNTTSYGERVLYGSKLFVKIDNNNVVVATIPTGNYCENPKINDLYGLEDIVNMLLKLKSKQYANALLPIVAVNKLASMSVYPTNNILQKFFEKNISSETV
ncbi:hypothetical protein P4606_19795 [Priestia aryabhattai]|uniref:hypothetical protein n=1 Tax=Priestia aryabhattai TaxID=412384 RepID=UPI002E24CD20|nr:hypothetical protein [Priestia aryabhattai]